MIKIKIYKKDKIDCVVIKGHAKYDDFGKDIVCASVSSIVITTINAILKVKNDAIMYKQKEGFLEIKVIKKDLVIDILIQNMVDLFKELKENYPKNIRIEEVSL